MTNHPQRQEIISRLQALAQEQGGDELKSFVTEFVARCRTTSFTEQSLESSVKSLAALLNTTRASGGILKVAAEATEDGLLVTSNMPDQPFIVDTIRKTLRAFGASRINGAHVVARVDRSGAGARLANNGKQESLAFFEAESLSDAEAIAADLSRRLELAQAVSGDFLEMTAEVRRAADATYAIGSQDAREGADLLKWALSDNFVFFGITNSEGRTFGADKKAGTLWPEASIDDAAEGVTVSKQHLEAPIHRNGRIDMIQVSTPRGSWVIRGVFTRRALSQPCRSLPVLRQLLDKVMAGVNHSPGSYHYRGMANMFDAMPTEWLFTASAEHVREVLGRVFEAEQNQTGQVHIDQNNDTTFALIVLPERRYSESIRSRLLSTLTELTGASYTDSGLFAGRFETVMLQVFQTGTRSLKPEEVESLEAFIHDLALPFEDKIEPLLEEVFGNDAVEVAERYGEAFPTDYADEAPVSLAITDITWLERARASGKHMAALVDTGSDLLLRIYQVSDLLLTELMPIIDNFGLVILDQESVSVKPCGSSPQEIDSFRIAKVAGLSRELLLARGELLVQGIQAVFEKKISSDPYNRLSLAAGLSWDQVDLLRGLFGYARQLSLRHPIFRIQEILLKQAETAAAIIQHFNARFNPDLDTSQKSREEQVAAAADKVDDRLRAIRTADEDTVLRTLANLVEAMLRTNFYRTDRKFHYISFKFDHSRIKLMPMPRLWREIYVHHREMEGLHLRGGPIARGGLRFSDRADFRTEVLGLVTTQMVKNVVIVPEGSKGGFYIKYIIDDPAERKRKGDELYQVLIRGMLDITDNIVEGAVVRPPRVVAHDANDPYLVVAADKGTAHLSDTANKLSLEYGFWLGDAFASGGSNGYDHKVVGITARGGWVLVRRHFREIGIDPDKQDFTCAGIGDCGGDVFGNGVIETPHMKLVAAFNHAHIFFDPNPDTVTSYAERRRLFDAVKGWDHYNQSLISAGGGVFDRKAKSIQLSSEIKQLLGTLADDMTPDAVINLILKLPVDLLWNGGIGTYVRASTESNAAANDPSNDETRVTALELRCKMVGEGGNLGFTQAARVEYALNGGRLNTDFVDNSGGVDTSDHEVNLKILLNPMVASGRITMEDRNSFLRSLTDEVAQAVLDDCNANGRLISLDRVRSTQDPMPFSRSIDWICAKGDLTRRTLVLPTEDDLKRRHSNRQGLTRPELAVLQAHLKMHLFKMLMEEDISVIPGFETLLLNYFPRAVRDRFGKDVPAHMLSKAIGMTVLLTEVMTDAGCNFFPQLLDLSGASAGKIAGAWRLAMGLLHGEDLKLELIAAKANPEGAHRAWCVFTEGVQNLMCSWLAPGATLQENPAEFAEALASVAASRTAPDRSLLQAQVSVLVDKGLPKSLATRIVDASDAAIANEVITVAKARGEPIPQAALRYQAVGTASRLLSVIRSMDSQKGGGRWDPVAMGILKLRYQAMLRDLVIRNKATDVLALGTDRAAEALAAGELKDVGMVLDRIVGLQPEVASLLVAEQQIRAR
jgi:glutamate dehydrogenase